MNQLLTVECKHVFFSVGQSIVWGDLLKGSKVELGRGNGAVADELTYQTAEPDIFVGGDVYTGPKFAIDAIARMTSRWRITIIPAVRFQDIMMRLIQNIPSVMRSFYLQKSR